MGIYELKGPDGKVYEVKADTLEMAAQALGGLGQTNLNPSVPSLPKEPQPQMGTGEDVARSFGAGVVRGGIGLAGLPGLAEHFGRKGINALGGDVSPETALPMYGDLEQRLEGAVGPLHKPQTTAGEYADTIGQFAPGVLFPAAAAAGRVGQVAARVGGNVVAPAVASETAGQLTKGTSAEPVARMAGALGGGFAASRAISPIRGGAAPDPTHAAQVAVLRAEGIEPSAAQITNSRPLKWLEQSAQDIPLGPGLRHADRRAEQFTQAALRRAGINAPRATDDVLDAAFDRIGAVFDNVGQRAVLRGNRRSDAAHRAMLNDVADYFSTTSEMARVPAVAEMAGQISNAYRFGQISGEQYKAWRSQMSRQARQLRSQPESAHAMQQMIDRFDAMFAPALTPQARQQFAQARREYRNLLVLERAATSGGENAAKGLISPSALKNATKQLHTTRAYARGRGDFAQLARAGEGILKELPQSGTAPRAMAMGMLSGGGAVAGGPLGLAAGILGPPAMAHMITSRPVQRYLSNQAGQVINPRASAAASVPGIATDYGQEDMRQRLIKELLAR